MVLAYLKKMLVISVISTHHPFDLLQKTIKKISPPTFKPTIYLQK